MGLAYVMRLACGLMGLGYGNFQSIAQTVCVNLASRENVGLATSTYFIMLEIGLGFGPFFLGFLVPSLRLWRASIRLSRVMAGFFFISFSFP